MNTVVLIPAYQPEASFVPYVRELCASGCNRIVAVDDGGGEKYAAIFAQISALPGCTVLTHSVNRGKGRALKTGYEYILRHMAGAAGVVTADCDGSTAPRMSCAFPLSWRRAGMALSWAPARSGIRASHSEAGLATTSPPGSSRCSMARSSLTPRPGCAAFPCAI